MAALILLRESCIPLFNGSFYFPTVSDNIVLRNKGTNDRSVMIQFITLENEYFCLWYMKNLVNFLVTNGSNNTMKS